MKQVNPNIITRADKFENYTYVLNKNFFDLTKKVEVWLSMSYADIYTCIGFMCD